MAFFSELIMAFPQHIGNDPGYHMRMLTISRPHAQALLFKIEPALYAKEPHLSA